MKTGLKKTIIITTCLIMLLSVVGIGSLTVSADNLTSGTCGDNLTWEYNSDTHVLTITGSGKMGTYYPEKYNGVYKTTAPWRTFCDTVNTVVINQGVTSISYAAFYGCAGLASITIPESVTSIGDEAFYNCTELRNITLPDSVTKIGERVFDNTGYYNDSSNWTDAVLYIGNHLIKAKYSLSGSYAIRKNTKTIAGKAFMTCSQLTEISFPDSVANICFYAFSNCSGLTSINIPESVTRIEGGAFCECWNLETITLPKGITSLGYIVFDNTAFYNNASNWSDDMLYIDNYLIEGKAKLEARNKSVKPGTTCIADSAFMECKSIFNLNVPDSVQYIGANAFFSVKNVIYTGSATGSPWSAKCINGIIDGNLLYKDSSRLKLIACCLDASGSVTLPSSVDTIEDNAFINCSGITDIYIPINVTRIGNNAFYGSGIKEVYYEGAVIDKTGVSIADGNTKLTDATWHYNSKVSDMPSNPTNPDNPGNPDNPNPPSTDIPEANVIKGNSADNKKTYDYKTTVTFTAVVPEGGSVQWYVDGSPAGNGSTLTVKDKTNDYTVKVVVTDKNGNKTMDEEQVTIKHGFFDILIWFFVHLFNPGAYDVKQ